MLQRAIELAIRSVEAGGGPFGAVVALDGRVVGEGQNRVVPAADPTAHAEIEAIRDACRRLGTHDLSGAELYASCEPCPMCWAAIRWARLAKVTWASSREDAARAGFDDARLHEDFQRGAAHGDVVVETRGREAGRSAFEAWDAKADRTPY